MAEREDDLQPLMNDVEGLRQRIQALHRQTHYEDLAHAELGLQIVHHALEEVAEHKGLGGHIEATRDPEAHRRTEAWLATLRGLRDEARGFLATHGSEDLETALKALDIAEGSLEEVAERYE